MGENEQGGMLRTVVVVGLVALIAAVVIFGVVGLNASMNKNSDTAVHNVERAQMTGRNLFVNSKELWHVESNYGATWVFQDYDATTKTWHITSPQNGRPNVGVYFYQPGITSYRLVDGDQWSFSFDIKGTGTFQTYGPEFSSDYKGPSGDVPSNWTRVSSTGTAGKTTDAIILYFDTHTKPLDVYIKAPSLELRDV